jgi:hypothetical protein
MGEDITTNNNQQAVESDVENSVNTNPQVSNTQQNENNNTDDTSKKFSQNDVNRMIKSEKEKAKAALLKELGVTDFKSAKDGFAAYMKSVEDNKTDLQKANEALEISKTNENNLRTENEKLQINIKVLAAGVNADNVDDFTAIVMSKVNETTSADDVINSLKQNTAFSGFFAVKNQQKNNGTGSPVGGNKNGASSDNSLNYGQRLAQARIKNHKT